MSRFGAIRSGTPRPSAADTERPNSSPTRSAAKPTARAGKKAVSGYFSPDMSRGLHLLALEQGTSLQGLMGEAFDDLMRKYGKHPFGER